MDPYLFKRLWRRPWLSLCSLVLSAVLCILMGILSGYRQNQEQQLEHTRAEYDILCVVTNRRGTHSTSLHMRQEVLDFILGKTEEHFDSHIRDLRITKEFEYTCPALGLVNELDLTLIGVNNERCVDVLDPDLGGQVNYLTENFYEQNENLCLVSEEVYHSLESDTLKLFVEDTSVSEAIREYVGSGMIEVTVAGYYAGTGNRIFISFDNAQALAQEISNAGSCDSISFLAANNEGLDEIYSAAKRYFGTVNPNASEDFIPKVALTIYDEQYRATVAALEQNIARTGYLLPIVLMLGLGVGFLISFLFTRNESRTYALMRTLGVTQGLLFLSILREQLLLVLLAVLVALCVTREAGPTAVYFGCYSIGCTACVVRAIMVPPTAILRDQE